ncbi:MAG: hypothetical protein ACK4UN_11450 [Limisphaerales bacterium]
MSNGRDKNYVPIWFWLLAMFVMALPCINVVMILVWAFTGENESRKNYFKALIIIFLFWLVVWFILVALGFAPMILDRIQSPTIKV